MPSTRSLKRCTLALGLFSLAVSAAPGIPRDSTPQTPATIQQLTTGAIAKFLATRQGDNQPFNVAGPWQTVNYAGKNAGNLTAAEINNDIYQACDTQANRLTNSTESFSSGYKDFVQQVINATVGPTQQQSAAVNATNAKMQSACFGTEPKMLNSALQQYNLIAITVATNGSDPNFLSWASTSDPDFMQAQNDCEQATIAYYNATDNANGDDSDVYIAEQLNIQPLLAEDELVSGITMQTQKVGTKNPQDGAFVPYYAIPTLNATLSAWQSGSGLSPFKYTNSEFNASTSSKTSFGGAEFGLIFDIFEGGIGGEHKSSQSSLDLETSNFELSFGALALLEVDQGLWFDDYRLAKAAQNPDTKHAGAKAIFNSSTFFGSAQKPGPISVYNAYALVGYQPGFTIAFTDIHTNSSGSSSEGGFEIGILGLAEIGGYAGSTSNNTNFDNKTNTLTIKDNSANAYVIGFVQNTFWTVPS
ncbi:hypothetical protein B0H11DRAFT_2106165 [Mycena galericulata]|nr:hypothetical protein B0H11DRAFT_2106165 [Mycena galericulata]